MRLSRMLVIAVMAVMASLTTAASPALAYSPMASLPSTATLLPTVCQESVCLTMAVESTNVESAGEVYVMARLRHPGSNCGRFEGTLEAAGRFIQASSNGSCFSPPLWCWGPFDKPAGPGSVRVRFISNPETFGDPVVFF